ncbi:hypothetical protein, conserved [Eimeria acervulina]|uniref:PCI domain-containing protein n=1 Tax=Eimeria acervulina TaxID=5801 RepID=U6GJ60_EIMAC|nr:hypothetical protein, conserved [Eimeria acervulina]CDI79587.1 hypothetical protein, conserved [Eimeria acervulina]
MGGGSNADSRFKGSSWLSFFERISREKFISKEDAETITNTMAVEGQIASAVKTAIRQKNLCALCCLYSSLPLSRLAEALQLTEEEAEEFAFDLLASERIKGRIDGERRVLRVFSAETESCRWGDFALNLFTDLHRLAEALDS